MATKNLSGNVAEALRQVAKDQIAQDIENASKFATKTELTEKSRVTVAVEQLIALYNGYNGTNLDYRNYLDSLSVDVEKALYAFSEGYTGVS